MNPSWKAARLLGAVTLGLTPAWVTAPVTGAQVVPDLVFVKQLERNFELFRLGPGDSSAVNLTRHPSLDYRPAWTADGDRILFYSDRGGNTDIWAMSPDGSDVRRLTDHPGRDMNPAVAVDGRIAFVSDRDGDREIFLMGPDGSGVRQLTHNDGYDDVPDWSPDGTHIAYTSMAGGDEADIFILDLGTGESRRLVERAGFDSSPSWSPDGRRIAFNGTDGDTIRIFIVNVDGSGMRSLPGVRADQRHPRWSPDGEWLAITVATGDGSEVDTDIWIVRPDGSGPRRITSGPEREEFAVWRPVQRPPAQLPSVDLPADLQRVLSDYEAAWQARDAAALAGLFAADGIVMAPGRAPARGREAIRGFYEGRGGPLSLRAFAFAAEGGVGWIIGGWTRTRGAADIGKFSLTLRKGSDGRWLIVTDMDNGNQ